MAWNTPKTWLAENVLTAAELNQQIRDNLLETEVAKATQAGQLMVSAGNHEVAMRTPVQDDNSATVTTSSTTPTTLGGGTPSVTYEQGGGVIILFAARMRDTQGTGYINCGPEIVGVSGAEASVSRAIRHQSNPWVRYSGHVLHYDMEPGVQTARLMYWCNSSNSTGEFAFRTITVIPL